MEFRRLRRKLNMIKAAALVSLAAALCLAGCSNTQPAAPSHTFDTALPLEEMGKLCYYRDERDAQFDADMEIVEGRIDAMTDGNYLKEETELETTEGTKQRKGQSTPSIFTFPWMSTAITAFATSAAF